jgi:beta-lactamase superfamily II metal-dependent hydrolase
MIDCGYRRDEPYWFPSVHYAGESIAGLIISNMDEDHLGDFEYVLKNVSVATVVLNNTINAAGLSSMKPDGMGSGTTALYNYLRQPTCLNLQLQLPQISVSLFRFPFGTYTDTNNLSLITFVEYGQFCVLFPGDLEEAGWKQALSNLVFCALLQRVSLFVTSHHGRESGCCADLFGYLRCNPYAFVISDKEMVHDTQETTAWYRQHARGLQKILVNPWDTPDTRYVFTTRNDCCISIEAEANGNFILRPNSARQRKLPAPPASLVRKTVAG